LFGHGSGRQWFRKAVTETNRPQPVAAARMAFITLWRFYKIETKKWEIHHHSFSTG
jgi:hypothetical protein